VALFNLRGEESLRLIILRGHVLAIEILRRLHLLLGSGILHGVQLHLPELLLVVNLLGLLLFGIHFLKL
jgi:hypothetical protein